MTYSTYYILKKEIKEYIKKREYSLALNSISAFVWGLMNSDFAGGNVIGSRKLDELCESIGLSFFNRYFTDVLINKKDFSSSNKVLIICTGLYKYGGTSLVIDDLARAHKNMSCSILATNTFNDMTEDDKKIRFENSSYEIKLCESDEPADKMFWLINEILDIKPARILLLNYNQDSVVISSAASFVGLTDVFFYHHADYNLCLGVHLAGAKHLDPHNIGFFNCRENEGLQKNAYFPLCVRDQFSIADISLANVDENLTTCSSASFHKFANFYLYPYSELIVDRLIARPGSHIHIGKIPISNYEDIIKKIVGNNIDPDRFKLVEWVPNLWKAFIEYKVDLFISSFPHSSGRTSIEAMGAGLPVLFHDGYLTRFHVGKDIVYPDVLSWKTPEDFRKIIANVSREQLESQSKLSREFYLNNYALNDDQLRDELDRIAVDQSSLIPPPLLPHRPDNLDRLIHYTHLSHLNAINQSNATAHSFMQTRSWRFTHLFRLIIEKFRKFGRKLSF